MPDEPATKRTIAFVDGQNLFHAVRNGFTCTYPNFDPVALARAACRQHGWQLQQTNFYTGVPDATEPSGITSGTPSWRH